MVGTCASSTWPGLQSRDLKLLNSLDFVCNRKLLVSVEVSDYFNLYSRLHIHKMMKQKMMT